MTGAEGLSSGTQTELDLAARTAPIAARLRDHFANGGSIADGIKLVEFLERAGNRASDRSQSRVPKVVRGSRLSGDWHPSPLEIAFALDRGMPRARIDTEIEKFRNYWIAKSGAGAVKRDWSATWRNWIITAMERGNGPSNYGGRGPGTSTPTRRPKAGSAWVASRIESMKDECQPSGADRRYRTVPTLPSNLTLGPAERAEIERHVLALNALCQQTPEASADCEATTLVVVTQLMLALPSVQQNDLGAEATTAAAATRICSGFTVICMSKPPKETK
jgi:hypothetical protein